MIFEFWAALGGGILLAGALVAELLRLRKRRRVWQILAPALEIAAGIALVIALALSISRQGGWGPESLQQLGWSLAIAVLAVHLAFTAWLRARGPALAADLLTLVLALVGAFAPSTAAPPACTQLLAVTALTWSLLLLGTGALTVAGSATVMLALQSVLARFDVDLQWPGRKELKPSLAQATTLALLCLGGGLALAVWWAWRATGLLAGSDARQGWLAIVWLLVAMSSLAWRLEEHALSWAAGLALLASTTAVLALLVVPLTG